MKTIKGLFATAGVENAELQSAVEQVVKESVKEASSSSEYANVRVKKALTERDEARGTLVELEVEIEGLKKKLETANGKIKDSKGLQDELDTYKNKAFAESKSIWLEKAAMFNVKEDDKNFDKINKIKGDFTFKENADEYTEQEIAQNILMLKPYEKIGYFGSDYVIPDVDDTHSEGGGTEKEEASPFDKFPTN